MPSIAPLVLGVLSSLLLAPIATANTNIHDGALPSYHFGAPITVECMNRSM